MSSSTQLKDWCKQHKVTHFKGVFCSDQINEVPSQNNFGVIFNYDPHTKDGSHWVACRKEGHEASWFDSYGKEPDADDLILSDKTKFKTWLYSIASTVHVNKVDVQHLSTDVCGQYSCWFLLHGFPDEDNPAWSWIHPEDTALNDRTIKQYVDLPKSK